MDQPQHIGGWSRFLTWMDETYTCLQHCLPNPPSKKEKRKTHKIWKPKNSLDIPLQRVSLTQIPRLDVPYTNMSYLSSSYKLQSTDSHYHSKLHVVVVIKNTTSNQRYHLKDSLILHYFYYLVI